MLFQTNECKNNGCFLGIIHIYFIIYLFGGRCTSVRKMCTLSGRVPVHFS